MVGFKWLLKDKIAGSGQPGLYSDMADDIDFLKRRNIDIIVNLTENENNSALAEAGFELIHFPIKDMYIPDLLKTYTICTKLKFSLEEGSSVLLHCKAGLGRTGTIQACLLVNHGRTAEEAVSEVRRSKPMAIQTQMQERFVYNYYQKYFTKQGQS